MLFLLMLCHISWIHISLFLNFIISGSLHVSLRSSKGNRVIRCESSLVRHNLSSFNESFLFSRKRNTNHVANAVSEQPIEPESSSPQKLLPNAFDAFYRFSRPHTVIGTVRFQLF